MLKLPIIELFIRSIPEGFLFIFASYSFSRQVINKRRYIMSSILLGIFGYLVRLLPINFGVHTIIIMIGFITLTVGINKINLIKAVSSSIIAIILMFISEMINLSIIQDLLKFNVEEIFKHSILKTLFGMPSLIIPLIIVWINYIRFCKRKIHKEKSITP